MKLLFFLVCSFVEGIWQTIYIPNFSLVKFCLEKHYFGDSLTFGAVEWQYLVVIGRKYLTLLFWESWTKIPNPTVFSDITHAKKALRDLLPMEAVLTESYMILT